MKTLFASSCFILRFLCVFSAASGLFSACSAFAAPDPLPLPDSVEFTETAKLPTGIKERVLACSVVSEDDNILVVETSAVPGVNARLSIDKTLIAGVKRGDPSLRPFAEMAPDLVLPPESMDSLYYDDKIDRVFRPFLKKYPQSPHVQAVRDAEKAYTAELQRVANGEFRAGRRWTQKSLLAPADLKAIQLIQKTRQEGASMPLADFKKLVAEAQTCFASEFFPILGRTLDQASDLRLAQLKAPPPPDSSAPETPPTPVPAAPSDPKQPSVDDLKKEEIAALIPVSGWNWPSLEKAVDMVWEAENKLKSGSPKEIAVSIDLIKQSQKLMPFLLARERLLRQQAVAYSEKALEETKAAHRSLASAWWHASFLLAAQLQPPENQELSGKLLDSFEKSFTEQSAVAVERRQYEQAKAWFQNILDQMSETPAAAKRLPGLQKRLGDLDGLLKKQINQQTIDDMRKALAEYLIKNDFEGAKLTLATRWEAIQKLKPTADETTIFAHAALDQAEAAFKSLKPVSGCQLILLAHRISPENPRVKTWVFSSTMAALALFLALLFPIFWIFARGGILLENLRYRLRLKGLRKNTPPKGPVPGRRR